MNTINRSRFLLSLLAGTLLMAGASRQAAADSFAIGPTDFLLEGKPFLIRCGEMHFARIPREYWVHRLRMAHAMGLNTICAYLFWNVHEPEPGRFNFSGEADVAEFCRLAQAEGLKVILRPGPYSCAEWDFGGFPYWLLKNPDLKLRTQDPNYLQACERYLHAVGQELAPLQITRGGPIIMVQVENEYGSYGHDREYIGRLRDYLKQAGFEVPLFTCDGPSQLRNDTRPDLFCVVNFGGGPEGNFKALRAIRPEGPLMCGEYYPGWFDSWGKGHHTGDSARIVNELGWMLEHNASFSIYMVHGGTSFGFTAGANCPPFSPQTTSYDYDAPVSEAGWDTPKFHALREMFLKHLPAGETLPPIPERKPVITVPPIELKECSPLAENLPLPKRAPRPRCMEDYDQAHGCILYRTRLAPGEAGLLKLTELHDYALVFLEGKRVGILDRRHNQSSIQLPARTQTATLDLLVDTFGHVNYGSYLFDRKGITEKVEFATGSDVKEVTGWEVFNLPLDSASVEAVHFAPGATMDPAFYRARFSLAQAGDTFLDFSTWGKGVAWINGHNLGRYWNIGPQQTLYCPGPWLRAGTNELIVFELDGATNHVVAGLSEPILNQPNEQSPVTRHRRRGETLDLGGIEPLLSGSFASGKNWGAVKFPATKGRYFCIEAVSSQSGDAFTTCAELVLLGSDGRELPRAGWKVVYADSEEVEADDNSADNVLDGQSGTFWHTQWESAQPGHPHELVLDLGAEQTVSGLRYLPRQDSPNGRIKEYRLYLQSGPFPMRHAGQG
ncbi:MAG TPA: beta-galactosidase [Verrucomicrobiae bacterium]|nr:beta-galactosidase [Verrucomicrobiae bacterium]